MYECLIDISSRTFVIARPAGWAWTLTEHDSFEIISVEIPDDALTVDLKTSWGTLTVDVGDIDPSLLPEVLL